MEGGRGGGGRGCSRAFSLFGTIMHTPTTTAVSRICLCCASDRGFEPGNEATRLKYIVLHSGLTCLPRPEAKSLSVLGTP